MSPYVKHMIVFFLGPWWLCVDGGYESMVAMSPWWLPVLVAISPWWLRAHDGYQSMGAPVSFGLNYARIIWVQLYSYHSGSVVPI